jgi:uncharacterized protein YdiU (UPF0061 family)
MEQAGWNFDNSYARLPKLFFSLQSPTPVRSPRLVIINQLLADYLGLNSAALTTAQGASVLAGNKMPAGALPIAEAYAGRQFGHFTMLGDGRAVLIGEQLTPDGQRFDIQLKGSGRTPYSRGGDGRAALGPMLREYIMSEAMHALGIPTTRSLAVVLTGEAIIRENILPGAVLTRIARSHIRVGTFEYAAKWGTKEDVKILADYTIERHYRSAKEASNPYLSLLQEVIKCQAALIAKWQLAGFIHGVMNTDNMAVSGETIDYGPCAFMDSYDPATVFSSIDVRGRYAYGNQPSIGVWNLARFAETLLALLDQDQDKAAQRAQDELIKYEDIYHNNWLRSFRQKLGLFNEEPEDKELAEELLVIMHKYAADYTNTFRALTLNKLTDAALFTTEEFANWHGKWQKRLDRQQQTKDISRQLMQKSNPAIIPRNHRVEEALAAAVENQDYSVMERLLKVLADP